MRLEPQAKSLVAAEPVLIPGLVQTADYTRAVMEAGNVPPELIESKVKARSARQIVLTTDSPPKLDMIVDEAATPEQRSALLDFAREMGGGILDTVVQTQVAPIRLAVRHDRDHQAAATLEAGGLAEVQTRTVGEKDRHCGNEETYYAPLAATEHAMPAVAVIDRYSGDGLGVSWTTHDKRNAFVGHFSR